jgi:hemolysin activation/secretion protein
LVSPINQSIDEQGNIQKKISEKTIFLKSIELSGNKLYSNEKLIKIFEGLINKDVTFTALSNAALKVQSLYRENGYITTRVILPKQDFVKGNIKVAVIESYLEDIVINGGTKGTRDYIKYMTSNVLKDNQKNQIFNFDDLERQLLLVKKSNIGKLTST